MKKKIIIYTVAFFTFVNCLEANNRDNHSVFGCNTYTFFNDISVTGKTGVLNDQPLLVSAADDYFRSISSGSWDVASTWQSSADSSTWLPATLVPDATAKHVVIHSPDSVFLSSNRTTINVTIMPGAKMNAKIFTLTVTYRFNLSDSSFFYQGGLVYPVPGVEQVLDIASNYVYNGTQLGLNAAYPEFGNLFFLSSSGSGGTFENTNGLTPFFNGLVVRGNMTINLQNALSQDVSFATGSSTSRTHTIDGDLNIINTKTNVFIQRGNAVSSTTGTVNIGGNLNITNGFLYALGTSSSNSGTAILNLSGNINNVGGLISTGFSTAGFDTLNFLGISAQVVNNTGGNFTNTSRQTVVINNAAGIRFNTAILLGGDLIFIKGIITTTSTNLLTLDTLSVVTGASDSGFVDGPVKKIGNTAFTFPVGKTDHGYVPIGVSVFFVSTAVDEFTAEYIRGNARALGPVNAGPGLIRVSRCDYWILEKGIATPTSVDITAYWNANNPCFGDPYITDPDSLTLAHFDGTEWDSYAIPASVTGGSTAAAGSITWLGATDFSPFSFGSTSFAENPLPITINYFKGSKQNNDHILNWKVTCNSTPSAILELQRSSDNQNFSSINSIFATALRCAQPFDHTDSHPLKGINYYRLKMIDADGMISYSNIVSLMNSTKGFDIVSIAPNPIVGGHFYLKVSTAKKEQMEILITDLQGRILQKHTLGLNAGFNNIPMNVTNLSKGIYQLYAKTADGVSKVLRFIVQ